MAFEETRNDLPHSEVNPEAGSQPTQSEQHQGPTQNTNPAERPTAGPTRTDKETMTEDFATALESFEQEQSELAANEDRVLKGTVISINQNYLVVDIGLKSEGVVPIAEVTDHEGNVTFQPGQEIDVMIEKGHTEEG
ncbi:MAG TPA: S1 RNA-binding domain-containing protein, partial [candidate division Zixibacteria bacterium]|nr:S1 RNA-binding domain-containing protein [candidate division Zixibacteria bacterium]